METIDYQYNGDIQVPGVKPLARAVKYNKLPTPPNGSEVIPEFMQRSPLQQISGNVQRVGKNLKTISMANASASSPTAPTWPITHQVTQPVVVIPSDISTASSPWSNARSHAAVPSPPLHVSATNLRLGQVSASLMSRDISPSVLPKSPIETIREAIRWTPNDERPNESRISNISGSLSGDSRRRAASPSGSPSIRGSAERRARAPGPSASKSSSIQTIVELRKQLKMSLRHAEDVGEVEREELRELAVLLQTLGATSPKGQKRSPNSRNVQSRSPKEYASSYGSMRVETEQTTPQEFFIGSESGNSPLIEQSREESTIVAVEPSYEQERSDISVRNASWMGYAPAARRIARKEAHLETVDYPDMVAPRPTSGMMSPRDRQQVQNRSLPRTKAPPARNQARGGLTRTANSNAGARKPAVPTLTRKDSAKPKPTTQTRPAVSRLAMELAASREPLAPGRPAQPRTARDAARPLTARDPIRPHTARSSRDPRAQSYDAAANEANAESMPRCRSRDSATRPREGISREASVTSVISGRSSSRSFVSCRRAAWDPSIVRANSRDPAPCREESIASARSNSYDSRVGGSWSNELREEMHSLYNDAMRFKPDILATKPSPRAMRCRAFTGLQFGNVGWKSETSLRREKYRERARAPSAERVNDSFNSTLRDPPGPGIDMDLSTSMSARSFLSEPSVAGSLARTASGRRRMFQHRDARPLPRYSSESSTLPPPPTEHAPILD